MTSPLVNSFVCELENCHWNRWYLPMENGDFPLVHSYVTVYQRVMTLRRVFLGGVADKKIDYPQVGKRFDVHVGHYKYHCWLVVFRYHENSSLGFTGSKMWAGWWFGTFFIFPYIGNHHPNWLIFFRWVQTTNQRGLISWQLLVDDGGCWELAKFWGIIWSPVRSSPPIRAFCAIGSLYENFMAHQTEGYKVVPQFQFTRSVGAFISTISRLGRFGAYIYSIHGIYEPTDITGILWLTFWGWLQVHCWLGDGTQQSYPEPRRSFRIRTAGLMRQHNGGGCFSWWKMLQTTKIYHTYMDPSWAYGLPIRMDYLLHWVFFSWW